MLGVNLPENLESSLKRLATLTGRTKSYYVREALTRYLVDNKDYLVSLERLNQHNPHISLEEMENLLGLDN